jgi:SNF2 family DNA or RNA helicase
MLMSMSTEGVKSVIQHLVTYKQGVKVVQAKGVVGIQREGKQCVGYVQAGAQVHRTVITFNAYMGVEDFSCTCLSDNPSWTTCRHIAATLIEMQFDVPDHLVKQAPSIKYLDYLIEFADKPGILKRMDTRSDYAFGDLESLNLSEAMGKDKIPLKLEVEVEIEANNHDTQWRLSMKMGVDKTYVVKNIPDLLDAISTGRSINYGKKFTYNPVEHTFNEQQMALLDFLKPLTYVSRRRESEYYYREVYESLFKGKYVYFDNEALIKQALNVLKNIPFDLLYFEEVEQKCVRVLGFENGVALPLTIKEINENTNNNNNNTNTNNNAQNTNNHLIVVKDANEPYIPLTQDYAYVLFQNRVHQLSQQQQKVLTGLHQLFKRYSDQLRIPNEKKEHFFTQVYPKLRLVGEIEMPPHHRDKIIDAPLQPKIYFERTKSGAIFAKVLMAYGDAESKESNNNKDTYLIKDLEKEADILSCFHDFESVKEGYIQKDEALMYAFTKERLPKLQQMAQIYYEKGMLPLKGKFPKIKSSISMGSDAYFQVNFEGLDYSNKDLAVIYHGLKEKKQFVRLKEGSFLDIEDDNIEDFFTLLEELDISVKDMHQSKVQIPANRALAVDRLIEDKGYDVEKDKDYTAFISNFNEKKGEILELDDAYKSIMRAYQKTGYIWLSHLSAYRFGGILADDMGLGKTLQTIAWLDMMYKLEKRPSLIITPTSLVYNWEAEVAKFAPHLKVLILNGSRTEREKQFEMIDEAQLVVISYGLVLRDIALLQQRVFARCVIDEAQNIKNPGAKTTKAVKMIKADGYLALTGTPIENNLTELWSIFDFIMPGYLFNHQKFQKMYEGPISKGDEEALSSLKRHILPFILRRMKKDVLKELPPKIETKSVAHMTDEQKKVYLAYLEKAKGEMEEDLATDGFEKSKIKIFAYLTRLRQICCHPETFIENYEGGSGKLDLLRELLEDATESGHKVLIFSQFTSMLSIIKRMIEAEGISNDYLDGATKAKDKKRQGVRPRGPNFGPRGLTPCLFFALTRQ